jgi:hypothetical protein
MTAKVIQGWFLTGQPKLTALVQSKMVLPPRIQTKLAVRAPGPPAPAFVSRPVAVQRHGAGGAFAVDAGPLGLTSGGGKPLPETVRGKMEAAFGTDFSAVRIHVGPQAERIGAIAFTTGSDIYFAPGRYQPDTVQGRRLLGHELAHVVQQRAGRVRNPLGSALAVVQDHALEAEADRLGQRAVTHRGAAQPKMRSAGVPRPTPVRVAVDGVGVGRSNRSMPRPKASMIQRTIWRFHRGKWVVKEVGTKGAWKPGPAISIEGQYFNDISGKTGKSIKEVRAGLADLMMVTGSLGELPKAVPWPKDVWRDLNRSALTQLGEEGGHIVVGRVTLAPSGHAGSFEVVDVEKTLLENTWNNFLQHFMNANGQLPYMKRQKWFTQQEATVTVDINFYYNRLPNEAFRFHKDTGGDNLFVNLIFNNEERMLGTEWIEDLQPDAEQKMKGLKLNLPDTEIENLRKIRGAFARKRRRRYVLEGQGTVRGGVSAGAATYVSWVDELVWHSTPAPLSRTGYYKAILIPDNYWRYKPYAVEAMRVLYHNGIQLHAFNVFCNNGNPIPKDQINRITTELCDDYMNKVGEDDEWREAHSEQIEEFAGLKLTDLAPIDERKGPHMAYGVDLDTDKLALTDKFPSNTMKATGVPEVRRRNSFSIDNFSISTEKRSFIRTWVRVHRRDTRLAAANQQLLSATTSNVL